MTSLANSHLMIDLGAFTPMLAAFAHALAPHVAAELARMLPQVAATATASPLVDKREACRQLAVSPATLDRLCRDGRVPFLIVGDSRRYDMVAVFAALATAQSAAPLPARASMREQPALSGVRRLSRGRGAQ